jgi:dihydropteroate synthase
MTSQRSKSLTLRNRRFEWGKHTYVMGIVNVSPDSFSGDGLATVDAAVAQAKCFEADGADIIDIGGQSTRPARHAPATAGYEQLSVEEEIERAVPAIRAIVDAVSLPLSIDSYRAPVVQAALEAGAHLINDIWGFRHDPEVAALAVRFNVPAVVMHNQRGRESVDVIEGIKSGLLESIRIAESAGLPRERLILDPGFGFGWPMEQNLEMLQRLSELRDLGLPLLVGTSRKTTIGAVLELPEDERIWGTAATVAISIANGADMVRVHDVAEMKQVCVMTDAIVRGRTQG